MPEPPPFHLDMLMMNREHLWSSMQRGVNYSQHDVSGVEIEKENAWQEKETCGNSLHLAKAISFKDNPSAPPQTGSTRARRPFVSFEVIYTFTLFVMHGGRGVYCDFCVRESGVYGLLVTARDGCSGAGGVCVRS